MVIRVIQRLQETGEDIAKSSIMREFLVDSSESVCHIAIWTDSITFFLEGSQSTWAYLSVTAQVGLSKICRK